MRKDEAIVMKALWFVAVFAVSAAAENPAPSSSEAGVEPGLYAIIKTSVGQVTARLFEQEAPQTVRNFVALATGNQSWEDPGTGDAVSRPLYNGLLFHRVVPDYVIQTGDPTGSGAYNCGLHVKDEFTPDLAFDRPGRLGIVNTGDPDTGGCQFFITADAYPELDPSSGNHGYAVFGQVVAGEQIVERISRVPHDAKGRPRTPVRLISVTIRRVGAGPAVPAAKSSGARRVARRLPIPD